MIYYVNEESGVIGCLGLKVESNGLNKCGDGGVEKERRGGQLFDVSTAIKKKSLEPSMFTALAIMGGRALPRVSSPPIKSYG